MGKNGWGNAWVCVHGGPAPVTLRASCAAAPPLLCRAAVPRGPPRVTGAGRGRGQAVSRTGADSLRPLGASGGIGRRFRTGVAAGGRGGQGGAEDKRAPRAHAGCGCEHTSATPVWSRTRVGVCCVCVRVCFACLCLSIKSLSIKLVCVFVCACARARRMGFDMRSQKRINLFYQQLSVKFSLPTRD